jgi:DNA repair exonuclease SbcCD nuclease subunit
MRDFSPILLETVLNNVTKNNKFEVKFLKSGDILLKTENLKQAQQLIKLTGIMDSTVEVYEHKTLNSCKGVIRAYELQNEDKMTLLDYLKPQNVTDLYFHTRLINGETVKTGMVFVTFGVNILPEYLSVGFLRLAVRPYIPTPMRCFSCHKYGHLSKHCNMKDTPKCYNCNNIKHIHTKEDKCLETAYCVNCNQTGHNSFNRNCIEYKRQVEIQTIKVTQNVTMAEAVKRSNINRKTYAMVTATVTQCSCSHCDYHNKNVNATEASTNNKQETNIGIKRARPPKTSDNNLSTDEENNKKMKVYSSIDSDTFDEDEMKIT